MLQVNMSTSTDICFIIKNGYYSIKTKHYDSETNYYNNAIKHPIIRII